MFKKTKKPERKLRTLERQQLEHVSGGYDYIPGIRGTGGGCQSTPDA